MYTATPAGRPGSERVLTPAEMNAADRYAIDALGVPGIALMENASRHVAQAAAERVGPAPRTVLCVCGGGNNGGDGFGAARHLASWGYPVEVWLATDPARIVGDAEINLEACERIGLPVHQLDDLDAPLPPSRPDLVIDALLGTGLRGEVRGHARRLIDWMNEQPAPVLSVDIPSGIDGETGRVAGVAVRAIETVTFVAAKLGHWLHPGAAHRGHLHVVDIGMPRAAIERTLSRRWVMGDRDLEGAFAARQPNTHKGRQGHVHVLGGAPGRTGAPRMTADAALRAGAGLVSIGTTRSAFGGLSSAVYEVMAEIAFDDRRSIDSEVDWLVERLKGRVAAIGPGLATDARTGAVTTALVATHRGPAVIDADGLNHLARDHRLDLGPGLRVITPHPGEAGRLLGCGAPDVQADRLGAARKLAELTGAVVVLKGAHTVIQAGAEVAFCADGNPGMASAGMGDVLTGIIAALLARGLPAGEAARAGVLWHARAGDAAAARKSQNHLIAGDVIAHLADVERARCSND